MESRNSSGQRKRPVAYAGKNTLVKAIREKFPTPKQEQPPMEEIPVEVLAAQPKQPDTKVHANAPYSAKNSTRKGEGR